MSGRVVIETIGGVKNVRSTGVTIDTVIGPDSAAEMDETAPRRVSSRVKPQNDPSERGRDGDLIRDLIRAPRAPGVLESATHNVALTPGALTASNRKIEIVAAGITGMGTASNIVGPNHGSSNRVGSAGDDLGTASANIQSLRFTQDTLGFHVVVNQTVRLTG